MNLGASRIVLRPRTLAEILDLACRLAISLAAGLYARLSVILLVPIFAGCLALHYAAEWPWLFVWPIAVLAGGVVQGVFTVGVGRLLFSEELGARVVLRLFGRRLFAYLTTLLLSRVIILSSSLVFGVGLIFAWVRLFFVHEATLLEGAGPIEALRRSNRFVTSSGPAAVGALFAILLTQAGFILTAEFLGQGLVDEVLQLGKPFGALLSDGGSPYALAGFLLSIPYVATARFLQYIDTRTRSDGWDIQLRFMAIAASEGEGRAAA